MNHITKKIKPFILIIILASLFGIAIGYLFYFRKIPLHYNLTFQTTTTLKPLSEIVEDYLNKGLYGEGADYMITYLSLYPNDAQAYKYYGILLNGNGEYKKSIEMLTKALEKNVNNQLSDLDLATIYYFIGRNDYELKEFDLAEANFKKSLTLNPACYQCYDGLGMIAKKASDYQKAIEYFNKSITILNETENNPLAAYPFFNLSQVYFKLGDYLTAKKYIEKSESLSKLLTNPVPTGLLQQIDSFKQEIISKINE